MKRLSLLFIAVFLLVSVTSCEKVGMEGTEEVVVKDAPSSEEQPEEGTMPTIEGTTAATIVVGETPFTVEIATTDAERAQGLMNRESLPKGNGMWFVFPEEGQEKFWMKDTLIPLDIIFVDKDMKVVHIIESAVPNSTELLGSPIPFLYVLEVNAGDVDDKGLKVGDEVKKQVGPK